MSVSGYTRGILWSATVNEARAKIEELTGIHRSPTRVRHFLKSLGLSYRKVGMIPAKVDVAVQEDFQKNHLEPRLAEAGAGRRAVFCVDAAHFVRAPVLGERKVCETTLSQSTRRPTTIKCPCGLKCGYS